MRSVFSVLMLALAVTPARAHFIYLVPDKDNKSFTMIFSDSLSPDEGVAITKVAKTKLSGYGPDGKPFDLNMSEQKHHYDVTVTGEKPLLVAGSCTYGVLAKKGDPYLLMYYPKGVLLSDTSADESKPAALYEGVKDLALQLVPGPKERREAVRVLFQGKPLAEAEIILLVEGQEDSSMKGKTDADGYWDIRKAFAKGVEPKPGQAVALWTKFIEKKAGELDGKAYKEIKHYATMAFRLPGEKAEKPKAESSTEEVSFIGDKKPAADPAATKLLEDARAARATWDKFPGFQAKLVINQDGVVLSGSVEVAATGKVVLKTDAPAEKHAGLLKKVRGELSSLVSHRLPSDSSAATPCAFRDAVEDHPQGRAVVVLNDELHSSYRIKDRQIMEVNRAMGEGRFTISVLENQWNKEKQSLPLFYVVNSWDKAGTLKSSSATRNTWTRLGTFDLPEAVTTTQATSTGLSVRTLTFSGHKLAEPSGR